MKIVFCILCFFTTKGYELFIFFQRTTNTTLASQAKFGRQEKFCLNFNKQHTTCNLQQEPGTVHRISIWIVSNFHGLNLLSGNALWIVVLSSNEIFPLSSQKLWVQSSMVQRFKVTAAGCEAQVSWHFFCL